MNHKLYEIWKRFGFYICMGICVAMLGGAAWYAKSQTNMPAVQSGATVVPPTEGYVDTVNQAPVAPDPTETPEPGPDFFFPLLSTGAKILADYSPEDLIWSDTLMQWQVHEGVDYAGTTGEAVLAAAKGTVRKVYKDDVWGNVVVLAHEGDYITRYASLGTLKMVKEGDRVEAGDVIGSVGSSAAVECVMPPHLHFEIERQGEFMDPASKISG